jgi:hypothetical protein
MSKTQPLVCTLDPAEMPQRGDDVRALGRAGLKSIGREERRVTLRFRRDRAIRERVESIVAAERTCCAFLDFTIADEEDAMVLTVGGPKGSEWAVHGLAYLFATDTELAS